MNNSQSRSKLRDEVYTQMMCAQARLSKDQNTQMGAVLVSAEGRVISTGYNGAPAGFDDETVPYTREKQLLAYDLLDADSGELLSHHEFEANKYPFMVHAEINALHYARGKVPPGSKLYVIGGLLHVRAGGNCSDALRQEDSSGGVETGEVICENYSSVISLSVSERIFILMVLVMKEVSSRRSGHSMRLMPWAR